MPWNPVVKFPDIVKELRNKGYSKITLEPLQKEIVLHLGLVRDKTIKRMIEVMEMTGFLKREGIEWIIIDASNPLEKLELQEIQKKREAQEIKDEEEQIDKILEIRSTKPKEKVEEKKIDKIIQERSE